MTNEKLPPNGVNGQYKQIYYRSNRLAPYTSARVSESDYLQTEVWRELRSQRLAKDFYRCQQCGTAQNVIVHHIRYPDIWGTEDVDTDLVTLCDRCHAEAHKHDLQHDTN